MKRLWLLAIALPALCAPGVAFAATDTVSPVMAAATASIAEQQGFLLAGLAAVVGFGVVVSLVVWGTPKAVRFFKRVAA